MLVVLTPTSKGPEVLMGSEAQFLRGFARRLVLSLLTGEHSEVLKPFGFLEIDGAPVSYGPT